jgi:hypothetical protein
MLVRRLSAHASAVYGVSCVEGTTQSMIDVHNSHWVKWAEPTNWLLSVVFVIKMKQSNTYLLIILSLRFYGKLFIWPSILHLQLVFLAVVEWNTRKDRAHIRVGASPFLWSIWRVKNTLFLTRRTFHHFCRLFVWLRTRFICGNSFSGGSPRYGYWVYPVDNDSMGFVQPIWLAVWLKTSMMMFYCCLLLEIFRWLSLVATLSDLWVVIVFYFLAVGYFLDFL